MAGGWFKTYAPGTPVRQVANVEENNRIRNILNDIQGVGCRIEKPRGANGLGWRIIVDNRTDLDPIPDSSVGSDTGQIPVKPYDLMNAVGVPRGGIIAWSGTIAAIPPGWRLCDGTGGTPDLRGRFILGTSVDVADTANAEEVGATGGTKYNVTGTHNHSFDGMLESAPNVMGGGDITDPKVPASQSLWVSDNSTYDIPYYALAYIMKL